MAEMTKVFLQCTEKRWAAMQGRPKHPASDGLAGEWWIKLMHHTLSKPQWRNQAGTHFYMHVPWCEYAPTVATYTTVDRKSVECLEVIV